MRVSYRNVTPLAKEQVQVSSSGSCSVILWVISIPSLETFSMEEMKKQKVLGRKIRREGTSSAQLEVGDTERGFTKMGTCTLSMLSIKPGMILLYLQPCLPVSGWVNNFHSGHLFLSLSNTEKLRQAVLSPSLQLSIAVHGGDDFHICLDNKIGICLLKATGKSLIWPFLP